MQAFLRIAGSLIISATCALLLPPISKAETIDVTAKVQSPLPTSPAIITSPSDQQHFTTSSITVLGTCGDGAYVVLYRNSVAAGIGVCNAGAFSIQTELTLGTNQLLAKVFNTTDNEGPQSPPTTVYYDTLQAPGPSPIPSSIEATNLLRITSVDGSPYSLGLSYQVSASPLVRGLAQPGSAITITFAPGIECKTTASQRGRWSCTLAAQLSLGSYSVRVRGISPEGLVSSLPAFTVIVSPAVPPNNSSPDGQQLILRLPYAYRVYKINEPWSSDLVISGGVPPYALTIEWGDSTMSHTNDISSTAVGLGHTFTQAGNFQPIIRVTDTAGNSASLQILIIVVGENKIKTSPISTLLIVLGVIIGFVVLVQIIGITIARLHSKFQRK